MVEVAAEILFFQYSKPENYVTKLLHVSIYHLLFPDQQRLVYHRKETEPSISDWCVWKTRIRVFLQGKRDLSCFSLLRIGTYL